MLFIHNELIKYVAETLNKDRDRLKFNWDDFNIRLKEYYSYDSLIFNNIFFESNFKLGRIEISYYSDLKILWFDINVENYQNKINNIYHIIINDEYIDFPSYIIKQFPNVTQLTFGWKVNKSIESIHELTNLTHIYFGDNFCQDIYSFEKLTKLKRIDFGDSFNKSIIPLENLINLAHLQFGWYFNRDITPLKNLINLKYLEFGNRFDQDITPLKNLINLKYLTFGDNFDQDISPLRYLKNLTHLKFGDNFDQDIAPLKHLKNLKYLIISIRYKDTVYDYVDKNVKIDFIYY